MTQMGRELKRVPLDFDWPLDKVWDGYLSPEWRPCPAEGCENGVTIEGQWIETLFGHDAIDRWSAAKAILLAAGLPEDWSTCPTCKGYGIHPDDIEASEAWMSTEPPTGEGYQLWETTSEGSPQTPVFATLDELCEYAAEHCSTFGSSTASAEGWKHMLTDGMVAVPMTMRDGSTALFL